MNWTESDLSAALSRLRGGDALCRYPEISQSPTSRTSKAAPLKTSGGAHNMNKWEEAFAREDLEPRRIVGEIKWYGFEEIKLRLADGTFYTPDFAVINENFRLEFIEVKGFVRDDAMAKFKIAARLFPFARFRMIRKLKISEGGGWETIRDLNADQ